MGFIGSIKTKGQDETLLQESINWMLLRGFGASNFATATIIMPFVGYAILYNAEAATLIGDLGGLFEQQDSAQICGSYFTFFQKLNFTYLGLFALGVSAMIFRIAAPRELKIYRDTNEFIDRERKNLTARRLRSMYRTVNHRRPRVGLEIKDKARWLDSDVPISKASVEFESNKNIDVVYDLMRNFHQAQDRHYRRSWVYACVTSFLLGSSLLIIPSGEFTFRVMCAIGS